MASTSRVSEKSLTLQPMNSDNYTAAHDGVQSLTAANPDMDNASNASTPMNGPNSEQNSYEYNSRNNEETPPHIQKIASSNDTDSKPGSADAITGVSKMSLNSPTLARGSSPLSKPNGQAQIQISQQFQDYPPIPIQRYSPSNNSINNVSTSHNNSSNPYMNSLIQNSPSSPKLMSSLTNLSSTRLNASTIPYEENASNIAQVKRNKSPFRDSSNGYVKQIKNQRRPLYTPAVLRVTENSSSTSTSLPLSHSSSESISTDQNQDSESSGTKFNPYVAPQRPKLAYRNSSSSVRSNSSSIMEYATDYVNMFTNKFLSSTTSSSVGSSASLNEPSRAHWKSNNSRFSCTNCNKLFNYLSTARRRHHCRFCGELFCSECLNNFIYLDKDAKFVMIGENNNDNEVSQTTHSTQIRDTSDEKYLSKVCHSCFQKYEVFLKQNTRTTADLSASNATIDDKQEKDNNSSPNKKANENTNAVPVDWDWSSF